MTPKLQLTWSYVLGPVSLTIVHRIANSMEIPFCYHPGCRKVIATKFCAWHGSCFSQLYTGNPSLMTQSYPWIKRIRIRKDIQYIPRNMHTVTALLCFVVVIHWLVFPYPSGLLHWHCGNLTIAPVPAKQPWWIWIDTSCEFIMNDCITTTKQSTTKPCAYFLGYTVQRIPLFHGLP